MDISPTKSKNCFALIPVEEWFPGIVNIPILTLLHVTVATTIVVLAWQASMIHKCFYDIIHAVVLHKFVMEVSNIYTCR